MKLTIRFALLYIAAVVFTFSSCSKDKEKDEPEVVTSFQVSPVKIAFSESGKEQQTLYIKSNTKWRVQTDADWLIVSPIEGSGDAQINITTASENISSTERSTVINISYGNSSEQVVVSQKGALVADCNVLIERTYPLCDQIAFTVTAGSKVCYFQWLVMEKKKAMLYTETELLDMIKSQERYNPNEYYSFGQWSIDGSPLQPETDYALITVGYDENGNRGDMIKNYSSTKSNINQPRAEINNFEWYGARNQFKFDVEMNAYASQYCAIGRAYEPEEEIEDWVHERDCFIALRIIYNVERGNYELYNQNWSFSFYPYLAIAFVFTYSQDKNGIWSGVLDRDLKITLHYDSPSSPTKITHKNNVPERGAIKASDLEKYKISFFQL